MKHFITLALVTLLFTSCKKEEIKFSDFKLHVDYKVSGVPLNYNQFTYLNAAGNTYEVTTLKYYLSGFVFHKSDGTEFTSDEVFYLDAANNTTLSFNDMLIGDYSGLTFVLGLLPEVNVTGGLPSTAENNNMEWPDMMGGGYHFMKFEGNYLDSASIQHGFAIHLGTNAALVNIALTHDMKLAESEESMNLVMDLNEWFQNPSVFDLDSISYTMSNAAAQAIIVANGADIFTLE
jgi:hypothetical protein